MYTDFNFTHGLTFVGAAATTACINVSELNYGQVQGDADELQGSLDTVTRETESRVTTTNTRTSEVGEHIRVTMSNVSEGHELNICLRIAWAQRCENKIKIL